MFTQINTFLSIIPTYVIQNHILYFKGPDPAYGGNISEKGSSIAAYGVTEIDECKRSCVGSVTFGSSNRSTLPVTDRYIDNKMDDYQEPYQALRYAPYYSYSSVVMEMQDMMAAKCVPAPSGDFYIAKY